MTRSLTLISHPLCPFVQRAAIILAEKGVAFERVNVDLTDKPEWFRAMSPTGKVPLLQVRGENGQAAVLFESVAICEYLDESQEGARLHPADPLDRARHRAWMEFGTSALADAWAFLNAKDEPTGRERLALFKEKLSRLEANLGSGPYFDGRPFTMVDAVFAPVFRYFDVIGAEISDLVFATFPKVDYWRQGLSQRESVIAAVGSDYGALFMEHLGRQGALLANVRR